MFSFGVRIKNKLITITESVMIELLLGDSGRGVLSSRCPSYTIYLPYTIPNIGERENIQRIAFHENMDKNSTILELQIVDKVKKRIQNFNKQDDQQIGIFFDEIGISFREGDNIWDQWG